ncbi:unnamed protein product [Bursaphelenchus okinawaensis]|uniref:Uncharacterized protein n=1 Tax=Bursaphelenchus okinawaensis TaxID=465554 RepID=A0A811KRQ1_9BILA|nr:unnamed protein product [Bursaphelenchus okinawaensis]CAG9108319.1 unnamed protein product [Bursaphelenchus okinawaensis]
MKEGILPDLPEPEVRKNLRAWTVPKNVSKYCQHKFGPLLEYGQLQSGARCQRASRNYVGGLGNKLIAKDFGLAQNASTEVGVPTPLGLLAHQIYRVLANNNQFGDKDFGFVYQFLKTLTNNRRYCYRIRNVVE